MNDEFLSRLQGKRPSPSLPSRSTLWANPTIQTLNFHPKFPLSYLGEMSEGQRGFPPFIFLFLQVVDIAINFNDQPCRRTRMNYEG